MPAGAPRQVFSAMCANCNNGTVTIKDLAGYLSVTEKTVRRRLAAHGDFRVDNNEVRRKQGDISG